MWISVSDGLPKNCQTVIGHVISGGLVGQIGSETMMDFVWFNTNKNQWQQSVGTDDAIVQVSHWMYAPKKPKGFE
jgi:hypothetical protein